MTDTLKCKFGFHSLNFRDLFQTYAFGLACALLLFTLSPVLAQSEVQTNASVNFKNEQLSSVLDYLSETRNVNFSYDANDPVFDRLITYSSENVSTEQAIKDILSIAGLGSRQIGNQIVLFRLQDNQEEKIVSDQVPEYPEIKAVVLLPELASPVPEYRLDTIYVMDTIFRVDTIRITDTVFVEKVQPEKEPTGKIKKIPVDFFQPGIERDRGWAMSAFAAPLLSDFSLVDGQKNFSLRSFSLGADAVKLLERWNITAGVRLTQFNQRFTQQYFSEEGGFFNTDTIDAYYTVIDMDTSWYYVTDSSWVPVVTKEYSYEQTNTLGYLEFNLSASFDVYQGTKTRVYLKAGGQLSLLIYNNGIAVPNKNNAAGIDFDQLQLNTINYSVVVGLGLKQKIADKVDFNSEVYYSRYLNSLVPDYPINTKINAIGLKLGFVFYL